MAENDFLDKVPPQNLEAEAAVLASCLFDNGCISEVVHLLKSDDFYSSANRLLFETIIELYDSNQAVDLIIERLHSAHHSITEIKRGLIAELTTSPV